MDAVLPVYKPVEITSYDVIRRIKQLIPRGVKIGHAGTLDPFADGVLLILLGKATKRFDEIQQWQKTYRAGARLGATSDTLDITGKIKEIQHGVRPLNLEQLREVASRFVGEHEQTIPNYSAAKFDGKPRYKYARQGEELPPKSKKIVVYSIEVTNSENDEVELLVRCGSGTYIRQLSYDIFHSLGIESYLTRLTREAVGTVTIDQTSEIEDLEDKGVQAELLVRDG